MGYRLLLGIVASALAWGAAPEVDRARHYYERTQYQRALAELAKVSDKDVQAMLLAGQAYFGLERYSDATDILERAALMAPKNSDVYLWLGRAWGRRAETSAVWNQFRYAGKTRDALQRSVDLDPKNREALDDMFEYYLQAPAIVGGDVDKAKALVKRMEVVDPSLAEKAEARLREHDKDFIGAERHLRRAAGLAKNQAGAVLNLAKFLSRRGQRDESDAQFAEAAKIAPNDPVVLYERAQTYIEEKRNLDEARQLLEKYMAADLTPDQPSRAEAKSLLNKIGRR